MFATVPSRGRWARMREAFDDPLTHEIIGAMIEVHRNLGPGLLESTYEACLCAELEERRLRFERQRILPLEYKHLKVEGAYRLDVVVEGRILIELKAVERLIPIHEAQVITYLRLAQLPVGLLVNFNSPVLKDAIRRLTADSPRERFKPE